MKKEKPKKPAVVKKRKATGLQLFKTEDNRSTFKKKSNNGKSAGTGGIASTFSNPTTNLKNSDQ